MSIVAAHGISKAYGPDVVLRSADVIIDPGQRVGMVGKNGAGKSTLARILAGTESPDSGQVARRRGALILHLDQVPRFEGDPTAREAAAQGLAAWNAAMAAHEALSARLAEGGEDLERLLEEQARLTEEIERLGGFEQGHRVASMLGHLGLRDIDRPLSTMRGGDQRSRER
jgi:ATP-binding cassette subfamily F protein uup